MKRVLAIAAASLMIAAFTVDAASARHRQRGYHHHHSGHYYGGPHYGSHGMYRGGWGNAAMSGNHGNSGSGPNSVGHIQGGNIGGGK